MSSEGVWTPKEESLLRENYTSASLSELSDTLGRSVGQSRARREGWGSEDPMSVIA